MLTCLSVFIGRNQPTTLSLLRSIRSGYPAARCYLTSVAAPQSYGSNSTRQLRLLFKQPSPYSSSLERIQAVHLHEARHVRPGKFTAIPQQPQVQMPSTPFELRAASPDGDQKHNSEQMGHTRLKPTLSPATTPESHSCGDEPVRSQSCSICYDLGIGLNGLRRHLKACKIKEIRESASNGCSGCALLEAGLVATHAHSDLDPNIVLHIIFHLGMPLRLESSEFDVELFSLSEEGALPYIGPANIVPVTLDAEGVAKLTRPWLKHCQEKHSICNLSGKVCRSRITRKEKFRNLFSKTKLAGRPRRLIQLLPDDQLRLVLAARITAPYIALSYCWGTGANYTTTVDTLGSRMASLEYRHLPKTIRDAIDVTRRLDIEYIWIDSICIIQDDDDGVDWREESANMDTIYEGALLTLSATRSSSVELGFIGNRETPGPRNSGKSKANSYGENIASTRLSYHGPNDIDVEVFVRHRLPHDAIIPEDADTSQYPLLARGWTFQERLLATRTIHFLPQEIIWECRCEFWCECSSSRADLVWTTAEDRGSSYSKEISHPDTMNSTLLWQSLVEQYSKRVLSLHTDRLPALSGVARRIRHADPAMGSYLAGLWNKDLLWHLLWQVDHAQIPTDSHGFMHDPSEDMRRQQNFLSKNKNRLVGSFCDASALHRRSREPTWSWISTPWPVKWSLASPESFRSQRPSAHVREAQCVLDPINPLGDVSSGKIVLIASITQAELSTYHEDSWKLGKNTQQGMSQALEVVFIPDGTFDELGLEAGDIIYCAKILEFVKDNDTVWVALGLRRLDVVTESMRTDNGKADTFAGQEDRKRAEIGRTEYFKSMMEPDNMELWLRVEKAVAKVGETNSDIQQRWRFLNELAAKLGWELNAPPRSEIKQRWRILNKQFSEFSLELSLENEDMILEGLTKMEGILSRLHYKAKVRDNDRPTYSPHRSSVVREKIETYYRVGIVTGKVRARVRAQGLPASLDWFRGAEERTINII